MTTIAMPAIQEISKENKHYIRYFNERIGHVPNLYLSMMHSAHAFENFYHFYERKTSLSLREREAINLVMAQLNGSHYCISAHTMIAKLNGFSDDEIMQLRRGRANFNTKLDAVVRLVKALAQNKGHQITYELTTFFDAGYSREHLLDTLQVVGASYMSNFIAIALHVPLDFPEAHALEKNGPNESD